MFSSKNIYIYKTKCSISAIFFASKIILPNKSITYVTVLNQLTKPITTTSHQIKFLLGGIYSNLYI